VSEYRFLLPDLGEGIAEAVVVRWHVEAGQPVAEGDRLLDVETEKALVEIPSPATGRVGRLAVAGGATVQVGALLVTIEDVVGAMPPAAEPVVAEDGFAVGDATRPDTDASAGSVRRRIADRLARVQREVPAVTVVEECDFGAIDGRLSGTERTAFLLAAASAALADVPELNATYEDGRIAVHESRHIGLAVQTADGLVVPVLRDVDRRGLAELAAEVEHVVAAAQEHSLAPARMRGSTFTVTEAGELGGLFATPLINAPEVAVLGLHRVADRAVVRDRQVVVRRVGNVSCSFDHRAVDGFQASAFLLRFAELVAAGELPPDDGRGGGDGPSEPPSPERARRVVREHAADVLGRDRPLDGADDDRTFRDLGLTSRMALELRRSLALATGQRLPSTVVYANPTPAALADRLAGVARARPRPRARAREPQPAGASDPIAIVGIGCRYPGGVASADDLWELVAAERDAIGDPPADRGWEPGVAGPRAGGFLAGAGDFDAGFFGISPREALAMDPQQRLLLEVAWEALEDAGIDPAALRGGDAGVFAGLTPSGYGDGATAPELEGYRLTGTTPSVASGRIAYALGLEGPAITVDTACSSSLVALHLACRSLRAGECSLALAGGAAVMAAPELFVELGRQGALAPDGRCKPFAAAADGTAWAEGAGLLVLERLSDAERHGRRVLALVRGTAVNQDGESNGLTAPSGPAQERAIASALADAGVEAADVDAIEAHGTGTRLGDPIEAAALNSAYGAASRDRPLWLGSIKGNIGHSSAAAGVAGAIKVVMAMRHGTLPRTLHVDAPTPHVDWRSGPLRLLTERREWNAGDRPRRAAVSSFGISGTNVHAIFEEGADIDRRGAPEHPRRAPLGRTVALPLSARTESALHEQAGRLAARLGDGPPPDPVDVAFSLATARHAFEHRAVAVGSGWADLRAALDALAAGDEHPSVVRGAASTPARPPVFVFAGQGAQWAGAAGELLVASPAFADALGECERALEPHVDWSLRDVLAGADDGWLDRLDVLQPALFGLSVALARLWIDLGVRPGAVVGHSQGEVAAAHVAGALSLADAARVAALRGRAMATIAGAGGMAAIALPADVVAERLRPFGERLALAARNGPASQVVSGDPGALEELLAACAAEGIRASRVAVDYAAHSAAVEPLRAQLLQAFAPIVSRTASLPFYSTVTGGRLDTATLDAGHWFRNLRDPVRFEAAVRAALDDGRRAFLEVGPHPALALAIHETADAAGAGETAVVPTMRRGDGGPDRVVRSLAELHAAGAEVDWNEHFAGTGAERVALSSYPFERRRYWLESRSSGDARPVAPAGAVATGHPLLETRMPLADGGWLLTGRLSLHDAPWLGDHRVAGSPLLAGTAFVELALHAGAVAATPTVEELVLHEPLVLPEVGAVVIQVLVGPADAAGERSIAIASRDPGEGDATWRRHAGGSLAPAAQDAPEPLGSWPPAGAEALDVDAVYARLAERGYAYGPAFRMLRAAWRRGGELYAEVAPAESDDATAGFGIAPALLDAVVHPALAEAEAGEGGRPRVPYAWTGVQLHAGGMVELRARVLSDADGALEIDVFDSSGSPVATVGSLASRPLHDDRSRAVAALRATEWIELPPLAAGGEPLEVGVVDDVRARSDVDLPMRTRRTLAAAIAALQSRLAAAPDDGRPALLVARGAVAAIAADVPDPAGAALWGLLRATAAEHPDRFALLDADDVAELPLARIAAALAAGERELALRDGALLAPRRTPLADGGAAVPPSGRWRLAPSPDWSLDGVVAVPASEPQPPLAPGEVRVAVRSAGVGFRDVLAALGQAVPGADRLGTEGAGTVLEVGAAVSDLAPGDRVMGLFDDAFASDAVADRRALVPIPAGWSFRRAAAVPGAFLTAEHSLVDLAGLRPGERVLIHAAAGGVGMAAVEVARRVGGEIFATASPAKRGVLRAAGIPADRIASSRDLDFAARFLAATGGEGVDVVLDSLAGEAVDASLRLLPRGGRFVELGVADVRDPRRVAADHPGVKYVAWDLLALDRDRVGELLAATVDRLVRGDQRPPPVVALDAGRAGEALRRLRAGRNVGKQVLEMALPLDAPAATTLITGGTGGLGARVALHLVRRHGVRRLLLASRRGAAADGAAKLVAELERLGAEVEVAACDVARRDEVAALLQSIPADRPLAAVFHAAGVRDDGLVERLDPARLERSLAPKALGAWHLHELTEGLDLSRFVLFSSAASVVGSAGQPAYAAANGFLDGLAELRREAGLPATAIAWGLWARATAMTADLSDADRARARRTAGAELSDEQALELFDAALASDRPVVLATAGEPAPAPAVTAPPFPPAGPELDPLALVRAEAAAVLGHSSSDAVPAGRSFKELGFDSLAAVELRNRLRERTGLRLDATVAFDHSTPAELADRLAELLTDARRTGPVSR
jgi:polyketide synthase 12